MENLMNNVSKVAEGTQKATEKGWQRYHTVWLLMFVSWFFAYADRTLTGPVVTWMIENKVGFLQAASDPHALGGLLGSLFFAGYMLTQFPGGYFGDKFGYRTIIIISIFWAGITTVLTGLTSGLIIFIALRVITGLGEGVMYSNDRSLISQVTPTKKLGLGMGLVITGLSLGLTVATLGTIYIINWAEPSFGINAWKAPFILWGTATIIFALIAKPILASKQDQNNYHFGKALIQLGKYSIVFLVAILGVYFLTESIKLSGVGIAVCLAALALVLIAFIYSSKADEIGPVLKDRNLILNYLSSIGVCWHLWFYGFWSTAIVKDFGGGSTLIVAALIASFNGVAGILGFPLGGKISDMVAHKHNGRRNALFVLFAMLTILVFVFAAYVMAGLKNPVVMSIILFVSGLVFFALQSVAHNLTTEIAPTEFRGAAFGMWNLIGEIGAVLSPVVAGALRDSTGSWGSPIILDGIILAVCCVLILCISKSAVVKVGKSKTV